MQLFSISNRFGRKIALMICTAFGLVGGVLCAYAPNYPMFALARIIPGIGRMGAIAVATVTGEGLQSRILYFRHKRR